MNFELNGYHAYCITENKDGCVISDCRGFLMPAEQMLEVATKMIAYASKNKCEIDIYNQKRQIDYERDIFGTTNTPKEKKAKEKAFVYLFECGGRYKIGVSKDIERRVQELDRRPFPLDVVIISRETDMAYEIEKAIHDKLTEYRTKGEWYELPKEILQKVIITINNIGS